LNCNNIAVCLLASWAPYMGVEHLILPWWLAEVEGTPYACLLHSRLRHIDGDVLGAVPRFRAAPGRALFAQLLTHLTLADKLLPAGQC
jgi:hypothetical protein